MKTQFTFLKKMLFYFILPAFLIMAVNYLSYSQTKHTVEVGAVVFAPEQLHIMIGDTVEWINDNSGIHNVNGTQVTYPTNPESFGNDTGENWTYSYVFNTGGIYDYRCDVHASQGMVGQIAVGMTGDVQYNLTLE